MTDLLDKIKMTSHAYLTVELAEQIAALEKSCVDYDGTALKLELDYKLACAREANAESNADSVAKSDEKNEFLAWYGERLVGFIGICSFGGSTMEVNGMVEPDFRKHGIFTALFESVKMEWLKRSKLPMLLLTDRNSTAGQAFVRKVGAIHAHSEYEMILDLTKKVVPSSSEIIRLRQATNDDAQQVAFQNAIYFGESMENVPLIMPEDEAKRGLTIYIAEVGESIIGKVNLQRTGDLGAIYGLGVLPEFRGRGLGRAILLSAVETFKADGYEKVMLQVEAMNDTALSLYLSCGFEMTSTMDYFELKNT
jgi:ribosomal protein S18 acetylase RimI-like enzyme